MRGVRSSGIALAARVRDVLCVKSGVEGEAKGDREEEEDDEEERANPFYGMELDSESPTGEGK